MKSWKNTTRHGLCEVLAIRKECDILAVFYRYNQFSKADLIKSFKMMIDIIEEDEEAEYTALSKKHKLQLCQKFLVKGHYMLGTGNSLALYLPLPQYNAMHQAAFDLAAEW